MASNPYAAPESDVSHFSDEVIQTTPFTKKGRLSLASFLAHSMVLTLISLALIAGLAFVDSIITGNSFGLESIAAPGQFLLVGIGIIYLGMFYVAICQIIKRLHDVNFNGWWVLAVLLVVGLILLFIPGQETPNRFGAWRKTRVWEKIFAALYVLFFVASIAVSIVAPMAAFSS